MYLNRYDNKINNTFLYNNIIVYKFKYNNNYNMFNKKCNMYLIK